jgi:hypothetical protein
MQQEAEEHNLSMGRVYNPATGKYESNPDKVNEILSFRSSLVGRGKGRGTGDV